MQEAPETVQQTAVATTLEEAAAAIAGNVQLVGAVLGIVALIAVITLAALWFFGSRIYELLLTEVVKSLDGAAARAEEISSASLLSWIREFLGKRNEFYTLFGQFALALGVTVMLVALIALRVVSAEAGLPLIAAIAAYVLGKGIPSSGAGLQSAGRPGTNDGGRDLTAGVRGGDKGGGPGETEKGDDETKTADPVARKTGGGGQTPPAAEQGVENRLATDGDEAKAQAQNPAETWRPVYEPPQRNNPVQQTQTLSGSA